MKLTKEQAAEYCAYKHNQHQRNVAAVEVARRALAKDKTQHFLLDEYLVTGADTLVPNPMIPQPTFNDAVERVRFLFTLPNFGQKAGIVWAPVALVKSDSQEVSTPTLYALAPELLAALQNIVTQCTLSDGRLTLGAALAQEALNKAKGTQ